MEQWKCNSKIQVLNDSESSLRNSKLNSLTLERKKEKKWTFGGLLKRISKNEATENSIIRESGENHQQQAVSDVIKREKNNYQDRIYTKNKKNNYHNSIPYYDININLNNKKNVLNSFQKNKKNRIKTRLKAKRDQYCGSSSSDEQTESSNKKNSTLLRVQSEDSINLNNFKNENNKKTRAARTERYMKRLYREDINEGNNHDSIKSRITTDIQLCKNGKKSLSDTLPSSLWAKNDTLNQQSCVKLPARYCPSYYSDQNLENVFPRKDTDAPIDLRNNELFYNDKYTWPQNRKNKITSIKQYKFFQLDDTGNHGTNKDQPPTPPPRSSKSRILFSPTRFSLQQSDIENNEEQNNRYLQSFISSNSSNYCNSLDRVPKRKHANSYRKIEKLEIPPKNQDIKKNHIVEEDPIIPKIKPRLHSNMSGTEKTSLGNRKLEHRRHSKNLEEALLELETIYNSLRLSDENLLDRAEQRSMEEYRNRVTTTAIEGSIKSLSDTSSSYELSCRHANFDRCHDCDTRLKDDMAYRRMHQNDRPPSIDPSQSSLSKVSYLTASPNLGHRNVDYLIDRPKSRRGTPDLIYDDVVFRNITHANNTLKVVDPQPPFGIPLGPVTAASESDYLHVEPSHERESQSRSLFIPKSEPDIITDDLAFRSLRADRKNIFKDKTTCTNFLSTSEFTTTPKKKRAVRSLSADLYGIIEKNSDNHTWYKKYIKLNKPSKFVRDSKKSSDDDDEDEHTNTWIHKKFYDIDINGNRPKSMCQGRIQVCIPQEAEEEEEEEPKEHNNSEVDQLEIENNKHETSSSSCIEKNTTNYESIPAFSDQELSEYQQLCRDLECLIKKTSEKVKYMETKNNSDSRKNSLSEFIEWEKLLSQNDSCLEDKRVYEPLKLRSTDETNTEEKNSSKVCKSLQSNSETSDSQEIFLPTVEVENEHQNNYVNEEHDNNGNNNLDDNYESCNNNKDSNSNNNNNDNLLFINTNVFDQTLNTFDEINQDTNTVNNSDEISSDEKKNFNDLEQINNSKTKSAFAKSHRASTSPPLEDHKALNNIINSTKNSEGRETTQ
ncbi:homeobox protein 2-like isoform X2 [Chelonus insularis]|uniref:homeobox protein 2-like isoform X2 n=1 Tax=Chelonus insularis TaxID=460826 RepID=UPI00158D9985|nr:homeobox protein 2-like isoform X2 [Chelonus insularis]